MQPDPDRSSAVPLFRDLSQEQLERLATMFTVEEVGDVGRHLTGEGASGYMFYVIAEGTADVFHHDALVGRLGPGDFFGEMAILGDGRRNAGCGHDLAHDAVRDVRNRVPGDGVDAPRCR